MKLYIIITIVLIAATSQQSVLRRRFPITVRSPEYIRLSSDPNVLEKEKTIAKEKGVNICVKRIEKTKEYPKSVCKLKPLQCRRLHRLIHKPTILSQFYTKYECCPGFEQIKNKNGCPKDKFASKYNIIQVAKKLGLSTFVNLARRTALYHILRNARPLTVFIPSNKALKRYFGSSEGMKILKNEYSLRILLAMHTFGGKWPTIMLKGRKKLESFLPGRIRETNFKFYGTRLIIQNARVLKPDQAASNGIIHVIDDILRPSFGTVQSILESHKSTNLFNQGLKAISLKLSGYTTVFVPSDETFKRFKIKTKEDLIDSFKCLKDFLAAHVVPGLIFTSVSKERPRVYMLNYLKNQLTLVNHKGKLYLNNLLVTIQYIAARNGAIFLIDRLLLTPQVFSIQKVLQRYHPVSMVVDMMKHTNFEEKFLFTNQSYTLLLPLNGAMRKFNTVQGGPLKSNKEMVDFLLQHIAKGKYMSGKLKNNMKLLSLKGNPIIVNSDYGEKVCVQGSLMSYRLRNIEACNAVVHVITSYPLQHVRNSILDIIRNDSRLSLLSMALNLTDMSKNLAQRSPITFFAPSNDAWQKLENKTLVECFGNERKLTEILKYHTISGTFYSCNLMGRRLSPYSFAGRRVRISLRNYHSNKILFNYAETIESDITANNGVLHIVDDVVLYLYRRKSNG